MGHLDQDRLTLRLSGAGKVGGEGRLDELDVSISGAGEASFGELAVGRARVTLSGVGEAEIAPSQEADITISGIGNVRLNARPARLIQHISGLGNITGPGSGNRDEDDDSRGPIAAPLPPVPPAPPEQHSDNDARREFRQQIRQQVREQTERTKAEVKQRVDEALRQQGLR